MQDQERIKEENNSKIKVLEKRYSEQINELKEQLEASQQDSSQHMGELSSILDLLKVKKINDVSKTFKSLTS